MLPCKCLLLWAWNQSAIFFLVVKVTSENFPYNVKVAQCLLTKARITMRDCDVCAASKRPVVSDTMRYAPAERPFHQAPPLMRPQTVAHPSVMEAPSDTRGVARAEPRKEIRSIGVSVVPTSCAETQTSPRTSVSDTPRRVSPVHRKESELSLQRYDRTFGLSASLYCMLLW